jgi:putative membrane protein
MAAFMAFLHHLAAFTLVAALAIEFVLMRGELTLANARRVQVADMVLGISAGVLLVVGLGRVFSFEKGAAYYFHSPYFITKLSLFIIVALISILPTLEFLGWRKAIRAGQIPIINEQKRHTIRRILHWELAAIVIILLCAAVMARGGWA